MTDLPESAASPKVINLRRAARTLIANTLQEMVDQDQDWQGACRKCIKDRMSDAQHINLSG